MKVRVTGDENEIEIQAGDKVYSGDLYEAGDDDDRPEIWQIDGLKLETEPIICLVALEDLARDFLQQRGIEFDDIEVSSDSFDE